MRLFTLSCPLIFNVLVTISASAQKISGRVLSESGRPASHVTVQLKNTTNAVVNNPDGTFTIIAKKLPDTLLFSAPGYEPYQVAVTEKRDSNFEIVLLSTRTKTLAAEATTVEFLPAEKRYDASYSPSKPRDMAVSHADIMGNVSSDKKLFMLDSL